MHAMNIFGKEFGGLQKRLKGLEKRVQKEVNKELLADGIKPYENNIKALYVQVEILKKRLAKTANETMKKLKTFSKEFRSAVEEDLKGRRSSVNVFESAFEFVRSVRALDIGLSEFGTIMLRLWQECMSLEQHRISFMSLGVQKFIDLLAQVFGAEAVKGFEGSKKLMQALKPETLAANVFQIRRFLRQSEEQLVMSRLRSDIGRKRTKSESMSEDLTSDKQVETTKNVTFRDLRRYFVLSSEEMKEDRLNYFILRSWQGSDGKNSSKRMVVYLTIDQFYSVYIEEEQKKDKKSKNLKLKASIMVDKCDVFAKREKSQIVITYMEKGFLWNTKKSLYFNLGNNELEDFIRFYQKGRIHLDYLKKHGKKIIAKKATQDLVEGVGQSGKGQIVEDLGSIQNNENDSGENLQNNKSDKLVEQEVQKKEIEEEEIHENNEEEKYSEKVEGIDISTIREETDEEDIHIESDSEIKDQKSD